MENCNPVISTDPKTTNNISALCILYTIIKGLAHVVDEIVDLEGPQCTVCIPPSYFRWITLHKEKRDCILYRGLKDDHV